MNKKERQQLIRQILQTHKVSGQELLVRLLAKQGVYTSQVTLSRDLQELEVSKKRGGDGTYYYELPFIPPKQRSEQALHLLMQSVCVKVLQLDNMIFLSTVDGAGFLVKEQVQAMNLRGIAAIMADGDQVWLYCYDKQAATELSAYIDKYLNK